MKKKNAPLAETDLSQIQGLTLEDLTRMHNNEELPDEPATTLELDPINEFVEESDLALQHHGLLAETEAWGADLQTPRPLKQLKQAMVLHAPGGDLHLDQLDDIRRIQHVSEQVFSNYLPDLMQRLGKVMHAHEQIGILYDRLSELSEKRGAAVTIIETAKQIESFEKTLASDTVGEEETGVISQELNFLVQALQGYQSILKLTSALEKEVKA